MDGVVDEQIRYYRGRAAEYDATSRPDCDPYAGITEAAMAALRSLGPVRRAVELGSGTGQFTGVVAEIAEVVQAVDSSPEMLAINAERVPNKNVERVVADAFAWRPETPADLVVVGFLLSHVPAGRFEAFWHTVACMLAPGGRVFLIDETAHDLWREEPTDEADPEIVVRTLEDGRRFRIVKVLWDPDELARRLAALGWQAKLNRRDRFFWGTVQRRSA
jgi:demethylmenaquinone methyltransferase/2-methoxy-6-polyprenyl-1,4-benzoquinol methylase